MTQKFIPKKRRRSISQTKKEIFLRCLAKCGNVTKAAKECGYARRYLYQLRESDPEFAQAWDDAKEQYIDWLEEVATERATRTEKPSDLLLMFRLKGERPEKYREKYEQRLDLGQSLADVLKQIHQGQGQKRLSVDAEVDSRSDGEKDQGHK